MTAWMCLGCAMIAAWCAVPPPRARAAPRRLTADHRRSVSARWRAAWIVLALLVSGAVSVAGWLAGGPRGAVLAVTGLVVVGTVLRVARQRRQQRRARTDRAEVAQACRVLASTLRVGQVPVEALRSAAGSCAVLGEAVRAYAVGGDAVRVWHRQGSRAGLDGLRDLARAWQVSVQTGAPMAPALEQVADGLEADQELRTVVAGELAAPRATSKVMAALPGCGIALGYLLGGDPLSWLTGGPLGWACLLGGAALACAGVLWIEHLARRAATMG